MKINASRPWPYVQCQNESARERERKTEEKKESK